MGEHFDEPLNEINIEEFDEDSYELKFFCWSRKIDDEIFYLEENNASRDEIVDYLEKCAYLREKFLDPADLTEIEEYYMDKISDKWLEYGVADPMWD